MYTNMCKHCHKVFKSKYQRYTCSECIDKDSVHFDEIETYLKKYPNSNAIQVAEGLGITAYEVLKFMQEGRLNVSTGKFEHL